MKGLLLAGGTGSRLFPLTATTNKHLLPIYDKPMIYYSLSVLMLAGLRDILIITNPHDLNDFKTLFGNGESLGLNLEYEVQNAPQGIAQAFVIGEKFIGQDSCCLMLADNIFYGHGFSPLLRKASALEEGAVIFGYQVIDPERFGVVEFNDNMDVISIEEKPANPKSNFAVTGLYFYDNDVIDIAKNISPSNRGELEITTVNEEYLNRRKLRVELLGRGFAWLDTGTHDSLLEAGRFAQTIESRQGYKIACLEEIAYLNGWIDKKSILAFASESSDNRYAHYLRRVVAND